MEFGGVGNPAGCLFDGRDLAATAAKVSRPDQSVVTHGFEMSTEAVMPAKAIAMLEVFLLLTRAMVDLVGCFCAGSHGLAVFVADGNVCERSGKVLRFALSRSQASTFRRWYLQKQASCNVTKVC